MRFNRKYSVRAYTFCIQLLSELKLVNPRNVDATSDTVKPLEMENITEWWAGGSEEGEREGGGAFTRA